MINKKINISKKYVKLTAGITIFRINEFSSRSEYICLAGLVDMFCFETELIKFGTNKKSYYCKCKIFYYSNLLNNFILCFISLYNKFYYCKLLNGTIFKTITRDASSATKIRKNALKGTSARKLAKKFNRQFFMSNSKDIDE